MYTSNQASGTVRAVPAAQLRASTNGFWDPGDENGERTYRVTNARALVGVAGTAVSGLACPDMVAAGRWERPRWRRLLLPVDFSTQAQA